MRQTVQRYSPPKDTQPVREPKSTGERRRGYQQDRDDSDEDEEDEEVCCASVGWCVGWDDVLGAAPGVPAGLGRQRYRRWAWAGVLGVLASVLGILCGGLGYKGVVWRVLQAR